MHLEVSNKYCPLCKRLVAAGDHPDSTRLCEQCRSLIHTILPGAGSNSFLAADQAQATGQPNFATTGQLAALVPFNEGLSDTRINSQEHQTEFASFNPVTDFDEVEVDPGIEAEYFDDFGTIDDGELISAKALASPIDEATLRPVEPDAARPQVFLMAEPPDSFQNKTVTVEARPPDETIKLNLLQAEEPGHLISLPHNVQADKDAETISGIDTTSEQEAADPWDDPLPVWEYSRNEYPLYVGVSERKRGLKLKPLLVSAALLLSLVAAYLVFQSRSAVPQSQKAEVSSEQATVESVAPTQAANAIKPASDEAEKADAEKADAEKASPVSSEASANVVAETQWRHALQALASSSEVEANLFAAKLVSAGIPAYVIPADIERRGKWYRVRIGGFNTAQEAQRYIADARLRAKAAGINLKDLNVVDYERP